MEKYAVLWDRIENEATVILKDEDDETWYVFIKARNIDDAETIVNALNNT